MEGEGQVNELFNKPTTIKIVSVFIAILFWLYVINTSNPFIPRTFTNVQLKIENEDFINDNGYIIKNKYKTTIDITIRGRQEVIDKVRESDFEAALDLSQIKSVDDKTLEIKGPFCSIEGIKIESFSPKVIDIQLARTKNNTFPVKLLSNITLKPGFKLIKITVNPDTIPILGEEALVNSVDSIRASLEIKDIDRDVTKKVDCKVFNKDGKEIAALSRNLNAEVKIEVAKEVPVSLVIKGKPAVDFVEVLQTTVPDKVQITGAPEVLAKISDLKTEVIDIENISQNYTATVPIKLPDGVKTVNAVKDITVNIAVDQLVLKDLTVSKNDVKFINEKSDGTLKYEIKTDNIPIQLKARTSDMTNLTGVNILPAVDLSGLEEGTHKIPLNITLPLSVKLMQDVVVEIKVSKVVIEQVKEEVR